MVFANCWGLERARNCFGTRGRDGRFKLRPRSEMRLATLCLTLGFHVGHHPMLAPSSSAPKVADCWLWLRCRGCISVDVQGSVRAARSNGQECAKAHGRSHMHTATDKRRNKQGHTAARRRPRTMTAHGGAPQPQTAQRSSQRRTATESRGSNQMPNAATDSCGSSRTPCSKCRS